MVNGCFLQVVCEDTTNWICFVTSSTKHKSRRRGGAAAARGGQRRLEDMDLAELSEDVQRRMLSQVPWPWRGRLRLVCRRWAAFARAESRLCVRLILIYGGLSLAEVGRPIPVRGGALCDVSVAVTQRTLPRVAQKLEQCVELLQLAYCRSFCELALQSLRLSGYTALWTFLPALVAAIHACSPHAPGLCELDRSQLRPGRLLDVHLCHCALPTGLGTLLPGTRHLRLWDCWPIHRGEVAVRELLDGLGGLDLATFCWACDAHPREQSAGSHEERGRRCGRTAVTRRAHTRREGAGAVARRLHGGLTRGERAQATDRRFPPAARQPCSRLIATAWPRVVAGARWRLCCTWPQAQAARAPSSSS